MTTHSQKPKCTRCASRLFEGEARAQPAAEAERGAAKGSEGIAYHRGFVQAGEVQGEGARGGGLEPGDEDVSVLVSSAVSEVHV